MKIIKIKVTNSSRITELEYDGENKTLEIEFSKGGRYRYWPITSEGFMSLSTASSIGIYFEKFIRNNKDITYERIT